MPLRARGPALHGAQAHRLSTLGLSWPRCWTSSRRSCSSSSSRPSTSARCSSRAGAWPSVWHPDIAPPGKQFEHERHLKAINEAADQLEELAEGSRGGRVSRNAVKVSAAAAREARAEEGRRAYEAEQRARARGRGARAPRPVRLARARPLGRAPLRALPVLPRVGRRLGDGRLLHRATTTTSQQWARVTLQRRRAHRPRGLAAVRRLLHARPRRRPRAALHDRRPARDRRGRLRARRPAAHLRARRRAREHGGPAAHDARLLAGRQPAGGRARGARLGARRPRPSRRRIASPRASTRTWARSTSPPRPPSAPPQRAPAGRRRVGARRAPAPARSCDRDRPPSRRSSAPGAWGRASTGCSTSRSPTTSPATSAPR